MMKFILYYLCPNKLDIYTIIRQFTFSDKQNTD